MPLTFFGCTYAQFPVRPSKILQPCDLTDAIWLAQERREEKEGGKGSRNHMKRLRFALRYFALRCYLHRTSHRSGRNSTPFAEKQNFRCGRTLFPSLTPIDTENQIFVKLMDQILKRSGFHLVRRTLNDFHHDKIHIFSFYN